MIIGIARDLNDIILNELIDLTFQAMVLGVGIDDLRNVQSIDRLKRDLKVNFQVIDSLMEAADTELLLYVDSILSPENLELTNKLNEYAELIKTPYVCLLVRSKIACATEAWWDLDPIERKLLVMLLGILNTSPKVLPIFLPIKAPTIAYRFIAIPLTQNLTICMLCGPDPYYVELETITQQFWKAEINGLTAVEKCYPKNIPDTIEFDSGTLGIMLINEKNKRFLKSKNLQQNHLQRISSTDHRLDILRTFFYQAIAPVRQIISNEAKDEEDSFLNTEQYWCSDYHKCHALIESDNTLLVLYGSAVPTQSMQIMSKKLLEQLLADRSTCWQH